MKNTFSLLMKIACIFSLIAGIVLLLFAAIALVDRMKYGRGLMFADVEFLILFAIIFLLIAGASFWISRKHNKA